MTETLSLDLPIPDNYVPSDGELDNIVYLVSKYTINWNMRAVDLAVVLTMSGGASNIKGNAGISRLVAVTCEYLWDHVAGEPADLSVEKMFTHIQPVLFEWYENTTPEERAVNS